MGALVIIVTTMDQIDQSVALQVLSFQAKAMSRADNCGWCQQEHATNKNLFQILIKKQLNKRSSSPQQPLNGQGVQRMSGYKFKNKKKIDYQIGIRLETCDVNRLCGRGTELAEELRKRKVDICGLHAHLQR